MARKFILCCAALLGLLVPGGAAAAPKAPAARPRLIVNIVVGSMRTEEIERYRDNFGAGGIRKLLDHGTCFTASQYDFSQTITPVTLATLTTGAMPSTHGVIGPRWMDYSSNQVVELLGDPESPSPEQLIAPTLSETLLHQAPESAAVTVAGDMQSAIVMSGRGGAAYWLNDRCNWATSSAYFEDLPDWVRTINYERFNRSYVATEWRTTLVSDKYHNHRHWDIVFNAGKSRASAASAPGRLTLESDYERLIYTPAGNTAIFGFAKQAIVHHKLGKDEVPDLLNICLDPSRYITEAYGPESVEAEDMYYQLDRDLEDFLTFVFAQVKNGEVVVVFTSDHGTSPSCDFGTTPVSRFNPRQFEVIVNGFLNVRYGTGNWVLACDGQCLWLNHTLIYERGLNLAEVQNEVAIFAMQFTGISHTLAATAMRTSYFGSGYARKLQNGFYPRRSGDVVLNFVPGCIEERERCVSASGSLYGYDTQVPLIFYGHHIGPHRTSRRVDMTAVAPTLAHLAGISAPAASEGEVLDEIADL